MNSTLHTLTAAWPWTTLDVLNHLWQSTAVGLVVLAVLALSHRLSARTRRTLAWMALVKFALPTGFLVHAFAQWGVTDVTPDRWVVSRALTSPMVLPEFVATAAMPVADGPGRVSAGLVFAAVWLAGFAGLFGSWLARGRILRRQILAEVQSVPGGLEPRIAAVAVRLGLSEAPRCWTVSHERAPGVLGVVAPVVILPRGLGATLTPAELEAVLIHEFVHVQRRDNLWSAVQAFFVSLFWFHPIVWLLNRRLALETEQSCDERVLEITGDPDTYAGGIVKAVQHALGVAQPGLIGATTPPVITRIKNIFACGARPDRPLVRVAALAGGGLLLGLSGFAGSFAAPALSTVATVPAAAPPASAPAAAPAEPTLSVDFSDEDIGRILRNVADLFQLRVVIPDALTGKTTVKLKDVTWREIFEAVLAPVGYTFVEDGKIVVIKKAGAGTLVLSGVGNTYSGSATFNSAVRVGAGTLSLSGIKGPITLSGVISAGAPKAFAMPLSPQPEPGAALPRDTSTITISGVNTQMVLSASAQTIKTSTDATPAKKVMAAPAETPVAMASLSALAAQSRLVDQAGLLKHEAEILRREVETHQAARPENPEAAGEPDPEGAVRAAALAAIDARRKALDVAESAAAGTARLTEMEAMRSAESADYRALQAENMARQQAPVPSGLTRARLAAPESAQPTPNPGLAPPVDVELVRMAQSASEAFRASGVKVYEVGELDRVPVPTFQARPQYPFALRRAGTSGEATIDFVVNQQGDVTAAYAIKFSHAEFAEAATAAVAKWKFKPGRRNNQPVNAHMQTPIVFSLGER